VAAFISCWPSRFAEAGNPERAIFYLRKSKEEGYAQINEVKKIQRSRPC